MVMVVMAGTTAMTGIMEAMAVITEAMVSMRRVFITALHQSTTVLPPTTALLGTGGVATAEVATTDP
jgi:hypothetical protein